MSEIQIQIGERKYFLNNNSGKYDRVFDQKFNPEFVKGEKLTNEQILAYYDKCAGLILDVGKQWQGVALTSTWRQFLPFRFVK